MARNVFISFRFKDGNGYKEELADMLDRDDDTVDYSEDEDRSDMSDETIKEYLYKKLRRSSVTIIILTPEAINHKKDIFGNYDDWMYDEIRNSLEDRENNRTNGLIAVYTPEAADNLVSKSADGTVTVKDVDNLFRKNMMNVKDAYKKNPNPGIYNRDYDSYCSLITWNEFTGNIDKFIDIAAEKKENRDHYNIVKRL